MEINCGVTCYILHFRYFFAAGTCYTISLAFLYNWRYQVCRWLLLVITQCVSQEYRDKFFKKD